MAVCQSYHSGRLSYRIKLCKKKRKGKRTVCTSTPHNRACCGSLFIDCSTAPRTMCDQANGVCSFVSSLWYSGEMVNMYVCVCFFFCVWLRLTEWIILAGNSNTQTLTYCICSMEGNLTMTIRYTHKKNEICEVKMRSNIAIVDLISPYISRLGGCAFIHIIFCATPQPQSFFLTFFPFRFSGFFFFLIASKFSGLIY